MTFDSANLTGWEVMATADGNVLQAGVKSRPQNAHLDVDNTGGWITRAVVTQVYFADEDDRAWGGVDQKSVLCDVRTYGRYSRILSKVPVLPRTHGLHDHDIYIPRAASVDISGGDLSSYPSGDGANSKPPTSAESTDGDHVLVGFLDNDPSQPFIWPFALPHPNSKVRPEKAAGRTRRIRHNGTLAEWDAEGNFSIDATGAAKAAYTSEGAEQSNSGVGGQIRLVTTDGAHQTSIHLNAQGQILLGSDPASPSTEPLVLGSLWIGVMRELIDAIKTITVQTGVGPSSPPLNAPLLEAIAAKIEAQLHVSDFIFAKKGY